MSESFTTLYLEYKSVVDSVANEYGRKFYRYGADREDFSSEFVAWMIEHQDKLERFIEDHGPEKFPSYLARCLRNEGSDYGIDIKAQATGYERSDVYFYNTGDLKALLPSVFDEEAWTNPPDTSDGRSTKSPAEGNNWVTTLADIAGGVKRLSGEDRDLLSSLHKYGWTNKELAEFHGITEAAMSARHTAALKRLQKELGGRRPHMRTHDYDHVWRGRHAITNSHARALQSSYYEEG